MAKFLGLTGLTQVVTNIKDWANGLFVTKSRTVNGKPLSDNITLDASDVGAIPASQKGAVNGVASLDSSGKVPSTQLPSYVDDVIEGYLSDGKFYEEEDHTTEITGESSKIYVDLHSENSYRWGGTTFVEISKGITLGETASTAFAGDKGKVAYDHSQAAHAPANAEANVQSDWNEDDTGSDAYIKNKPTALPADGGNADTVNGHTVEANVPADPLAGKHILFAGDSLVSGLGWKGGFANCLQEDHPTAIITNVAEAGALLTYAHDRPWIAQQLMENIAGKDILIFDGGFNDIVYPGKVMGTVPEDIAYNSNPTTVADDFAKWLWLAREANPTMDIFYIIPCMYRSTQTSGTNTSVWNEFAEILKTICGYYSVGVIDLRFNGRVPLYSPLGETTNPYMYDSIHPNELGYRKLAPFIDHEICKCYI